MAEGRLDCSRFDPTRKAETPVADIGLKSDLTYCESVVGSKGPKSKDFSRNVKNLVSEIVTLKRKTNALLKGPTTSLHHLLHEANGRLQESQNGLEMSESEDKVEKKRLQLRQFLAVFALRDAEAQAAAMATNVAALEASASLDYREVEMYKNGVDQEEDPVSRDTETGSTRSG